MSQSRLIDAIIVIAFVTHMTIGREHKVSVCRFAHERRAGRQPMNLFQTVSPDGGVFPLEHELPERFGCAGHAEEIRGVQVPENLRNHRIHLSLDFGSRKRSKGHTSREMIGVIQGSASKRASC